MIIDIDPTVDFACKRVLGNPEHPEVTIHFLNAVVRPNVPIVQVEVVNPIVERKFEADKLSMLDILAIDSTGRPFNVEVQRTVPLWLPQRLTYYAATQLVEQIGEGESYLKLRPSIGICILNATLLRSESGYHHQFRLRSEKGLEFTDCLEIHLLELPKYVIPGDNQVIDDPTDQWAYFFRRAKGSTREELIHRLPGPVFAIAAGELEMISRSVEERRLYNARLKMELDENTKIQAALIEGKLEGKLEGKFEGKIEGEIKSIRMLQELAQTAVSQEAELRSMSLGELEKMAALLQEKLRNRITSTPSSTNS